MKKALIIGGTGVMGSYLSHDLLDRGYSVEVCSRSVHLSNYENLSYVIGDFIDFRTIRSFLTGKHYDAIIDFMTYTTAQFAERYELLLEHTDHFIFLSSYRAYSDIEIPTRENSPRLLDIVDDREFLDSDDYSLFKAREENIIRSSKYKNWTIVRPAITYSARRVAFVTLELPLMLRRAKAKKPIYIPDEVFNIEATCTWAGDVAKMIALLVQNEKAYCEAFSVCTSEHQTWGTIAGYYKDLIGADVRGIPTQDYLDFFGNRQVNRWQLRYDRCMQRVMDNSKVLDATGMKQENLMTIRDGIEKAITEASDKCEWPDYTLLLNIDAAMDDYMAKIKQN